MTKPLSEEERKKNKKTKEVQKQQKAASTTSTHVTQPKHEESADLNLCDACAYEFGECEGKPKFASDQDEALTGPAADRVTACEAFLNVESMPTVEELNKTKPPGLKSADIDYPDIVLVCIGGCGNTTEGMTFETRSGEFRQIDESGVPEWTCQECVVRRDADKGSDEAEMEETEGPAEPVFVAVPGPVRPDPKRFQVEEDHGACPSCERTLKRTALNRYVDAVRCTNPRCRSYRGVVKTLSTGVN